MSLAAAVCIGVTTAGGCGKSGPEVYLDTSEPETVITMFVQNEELSEAVEECCKDKINASGGENIVLYADAASYYAKENQSYRELLLKRMESQKADDLFLIPAEDVLEYDRRGYLYDLSGLDCVGNLSDDALMQSIYNGKVFSIPMSYACFGFIWNVDLLSSLGLEIPENLGEFMEVCETLKENGIVAYGANCDFALCVPAMCVGLAPIYQSGKKEELVAELSDGTTPVSTYMRDGFAFLEEMIEKGYLDPAQAISTLPGSEEEHRLFSEGKCAFISSLCRKKAFENPYPFEVKMTALPVLEDGSICVVGADQRIAVNPNSPNLEEAITIVEALGRTDSLNQMAKEFGKISSAGNGDGSPLPEADELIACAAGGGQIPNQDFRIHFNIWNTVKALGVKLCEGAGVDQVCREFDALQQQELEAYRGED